MQLSKQEAMEMQKLGKFPWPKVGCILVAVGKFAVCEIDKGKNCGNNLVADISACLKS